MPTLATPNFSSTPGPDQNDQSNVPAQLSQLYGTSLALKRRAIVVSAGAGATLQFQLFDRTGTPSNLTLYGIGIPGPLTSADVIFKIKEVIDTSAPLYTVTGCSIIDATVGSVSVVLPPGVAFQPGVFAGEFGVLNSSNVLAFTNKLYVWVDRGLFGTPSVAGGGPPQIDEIRNSMADYDPGYNLILGDFEQDTTNICLATETAVRMWNEAQPPLDLKYSTITYPPDYRNYWLQGVIGQLYVTTANGFLRNHLPYQASGVAVDDLNKWQQYLQIGQQILAEYKEWIKQKKTQINCEGAITSFGSGYMSYEYFH